MQVERESIDFVDPTLALFNQEMLAVCGIFSRLLYEDAIKAAKNADTSIQVAIHLWNTFAYAQTTPHEIVGQIMQEAFFRCTREEITAPSTQGLMPVNRIRLHEDAVLKFSTTIPLLPPTLLKEATKMSMTLQKRGLIFPVSLQDVIGDLQSRVLSHEALAALLHWWQDYARRFGPIDGSDVARFYDMIRFNVVTDGEAAEQVTSLARIRFFIVPKIIAPSMPLPPEVLPYSVSKHFSFNELKNFG